jgi:EF hand
MKPITTLCILLSSCLIAGAEGKPDKPHHKGPPPEILKKFDKDGDGTLSQAEKDAMREAMKELHKDKFKEFDKDGDGKLSEEEREAMKEARKAEWLKKYDTDGDGKLSEEERKAMPERPHGPRGKGPGGEDHPGKRDGKGKGRDMKPAGEPLEKPTTEVE